MCIEKYYLVFLIIADVILVAFMIAGMVAYLKDKTKDKY